MRMSFLSLFITLLFFAPFLLIVLQNDIERESTREILQTDKIVSEVKDILLQDSVHNREHEGIEIGSILSRYRTFKNDKLKILVNDDQVLYEGVSNVHSYINLKIIEVMANVVARQEKEKYESEELTPTIMNVVKKEEDHYLYKLVYHLDHEGHQDKITVERDITELYAKSIHNTLTYGGWTFVFLYIMVVGIAYLMQVMKLRKVERVIGEQQRVLARQGSEKYTNVGQKYGNLLGKVSDILINIHIRAQDTYVANKNLLQDISHETSSRLTEIKQSVDLIRYYGTEDKEQVDKLLSRIEAATLNISSVQNTFIDLAKLENYEPIDVTATYNVRELINFAVDVASKQYRDINFINVDRGIEKYFRIHREHFLLVMRSLLENAVKYSKDSKKIKVELLDKPEYQGYVAIKITNWGSYIPEKERQRIFERYYRGTNVRRNKHGIGLGLHIVKKILELYAGWIEVESDISGETSFIFVFPEKRED